MSYQDSEFWDAYGDYLKESRPRHVRATRSLGLGTMLSNGHLLDLGCGEYASALTLLNPLQYTGVDSVKDPGARAMWDGDQDVELCHGDYRAKQRPRFPKCDAFSSLFSAECTATSTDNHRLYLDTFKETGARWGLVSGFFYRDRANKETVTEAGGLVSYQTRPTIPLMRGVIEETRLIVDAPSKLFGPEVVEVWRLLEVVV